MSLFFLYNVMKLQLNTKCDTELDFLGTDEKYMYAYYIYLYILLR